MLHTDQLITERHTTFQFFFFLGIKINAFDDKSPAADVPSPLWPSPEHTNIPHPNPPTHPLTATNHVWKTAFFFG